MTPRTVTLNVNGTSHQLGVEPRELLSDVLRHRLGLTGTRVGCEHGVCGACTILLDGLPARSCTALAVSVDGREIETIEGVIDSEEGRRIAQCFHDAHALQCGFCSPGFVVSLTSARREGVSLAEALDDIVPGHTCRCTGYVNIRAAVRAAWETDERA